MSKLTTRFGVVTVVLVALFLLLQRFDSLQVRRGWGLGGDGPVHGEEQATAVQVGDKVVVMAKLQREDTDWVAAELPE